MKIQLDFVSDDTVDGFSWNSNNKTRKIKQPFSLLHIAQKLKYSALLAYKILEFEKRVKTHGIRRMNGEGIICVQNYYEINDNLFKMKLLLDFELYTQTCI